MKRIIVIFLVLTVVISGVIASVPKMFDFGTQASTPILPLTIQTGDLVVGEGETQTIENETFILEGNITVSSGGTLIIKNSDITVNSHYKNNYWVRVYSYGTLLVENSLLREGPVPGLASVGSFGGIDDFRMGETCISPEGDGAQILLRNSTSELRTGPGPATVVTLESSYLSILFWRSFSSTTTTLNDSSIIVVHMWLTGEIEENVEFSGLGGGENQSMHLSIEGGTLDIENTLVSSYSMALWVSYGETECRKNITVRDSTLNEIFAVFPTGSDIRLWDMAPAYFENWNIYDSMDGSGVPWNLTLINTTLGKWKLDFHGVAEIENSNFHLDTWNNVSVTVRNSTIILHHTRGGYVKFVNTVISQSLGPPASMRFLYQPDVSGPNPPYVYEFENSTLGPYAELEFTNDNIYSTFKGNLSVNISFDQVYWFGGTVDSEYPVQVLGANGAPIAGVQLSLVRSDDTQVWSGVTDENGRVSFHLVFGKDNYTENFTLISVNDTDIRMEVGFLTSTPISLISRTHAPIYINGNSDFAAQATSEGWTGNGSESNPYIIENYDINASGADGIHIENTDKYFVIRNCTIHDGKSNYSGIYLNNVINGKIDNVTSCNNSDGIELGYSSDNNIANCLVYNNSCGIYLISSSNNNITNSAVYNNSYDGIGLSYSSNNNITNCDVYGNKYGIGLSYSSNNIITNCAVYNNFYDGIGLSPSSNNSQITNCKVYNNYWYGIFLGGSSDNQITNCDVYNTSFFGIYLCGYFGDCSYNQITNCNVYNNSYYGIKLYYSSNNLIWNNYFNNTNNVYSSGGYGNRWNITKTLGTNIINGPYLGGNYWGDYTGIDLDGNGLGDAPYIIQGGSGEQDNLPLVKVVADTTKPEISSVQASPATQEVYNWVAITAIISDNVMVNEVRVNITYPNGTLLGNFSVGVGIGLDAHKNGTYWYGIACSVLGTYSFYIWANDTGGNENISQAYYFTIQDTTKPEILNAQALPNPQEGSGYVNITCTVTDNVVVDKIYVDITGPAVFTPINITMARITGTDNYYYNSTYSIAGEYSYYIWANDTSDNEDKSALYQFIITAPPALTPISITEYVNGKEVNITGICTGTINVNSTAPPQPLPQNLQYILCINVTATGTLTYANITIKYNNSDVADIDELTLKMYYWDGTQWQLCNSTGVDTLNNIVWANVTHLTIFAPMAEKAAEAAPTPVNLFLYAGIAAIIIIVILTTSLLVVAKRRKKLKEAK